MPRSSLFTLASGSILLAASLLFLPGCGRGGRDRARQQITQAGRAFTPGDFVKAAAAGDRGLVEAYLRGGMDRNSVDANGLTPLMAAAAGGKVDVAKTLLDENANPDLADKDGDTALILAAAANQPDTVRTLVEGNADVRARNKKNHTALFEAANARHDAVVDVLLATSKDQLARDGQINNTLLVAAVLDNPRLLGTLLDHGANPNAKLDGGQTALMFAAQFGKGDIADALLTRGANPRLVDGKGNSASTIALQNGHPDLAKLIDGHVSGAPAPATTPPPAVAAVAANSPPPAPGAADTPGAGNAPPALSPADEASASRERTWLKQNGVEPAALLKKDTGQDDDHDGFTNDEELAAGTDPNDPKSHPPVYTKLRLRRVDGEKFPIVFDAYNPKNDHVSLTVHEGGRFGGGDGERKLELKPGERISGLPFKVGGVLVKKGFEKDTGNPLDLTQVTLLNTDTSRKIVLRRGLVSNSPDATAVLVLKLDGSQIPVRLGQQFSLPGEPQTKLEVIDIRPEQVVLKIVGTKQTVTVDKEQ